MAKKKRKVEEHKGLVLVQVLMPPDLRDAANKVAAWDRMDRSEYIRRLILEDARRRNALPTEGER